MEQIGPEIDSLTHWLTDCPSEFYQLPIRSGRAGRESMVDATDVPIDVVAIASDHLRDLSLPSAEIQKAGNAIAKMTGTEQRMVAIAVWLLREPWLMGQTQLGSQVVRLLSGELRELACTINPVSTVTDPDRREELARLCLSKLGLRPAGETTEQARDRLNTLDSVERIRVVSQTREAEARARAIRQAMAKKRAQEAAARYSPE